MVKIYPQFKKNDTTLFLSFFTFSSHCIPIYQKHIKSTQNSPATPRMSGSMPYETGQLLDIDRDDLISHVVGSAKDKCKTHSSWKKFWMDHTGRQWPICQTHNCSKNATCGAHIFIKGLQRKNGYCFILPTCTTCNKVAENDWTRHDPVEWESAKLNAVAVVTSYPRGALEYY